MLGARAARAARPHVGFSGAVVRPASAIDRRARALRRPAGGVVRPASAVVRPTRAGRRTQGTCGSTIEESGASDDAARMAGRWSGTSGRRDASSIACGRPIIRSSRAAGRYDRLPARRSRLPMRCDHLASPCDRLTSPCDRVARDCGGSASRPARVDDALSRSAVSTSRVISPEGSIDRSARSAGRPGGSISWAVQSVGWAVKMTPR